MRSQRRWAAQLRFWIPVAAVLALLAVGVALAVQGARTTPAARTLPVTVMSGDWEPYSGPQLSSGGPAIEILVDVLDLAGFEADVKFTTWESAAQGASDGTAFGTYPLVANASRSETMLFSDPVIEFEYVLFHRATDGVPATSAADLSQLRVGGIAGYDYWPEFDSAATDLTIYPDASVAMQALSRGEVDIVAEGLRSGRAALADPAIDVDARSIVVMDSDAAWARSTQGLHFAMPNTRESEGPMAQFNQALAAYQNGQEYARHLEAIDGTAPPQVLLIPLGDGGLVALRSEQGVVMGQSPAGTQATVLDWPTSWSADGDVGGLARVKIASGPHTGEIHYVEGAVLQMVQP